MIPILELATLASACGMFSPDPFTAQASLVVFCACAAALIVRAFVGQQREQRPGGRIIE